MADKTGISWTDATWNPVTGCSKVSPGCDNCYAETVHSGQDTLLDGRKWEEFPAMPEPATQGALL